MPDVEEAPCLFSPSTAESLEHAKQPFEIPENVPSSSLQRPQQVPIIVKYDKLRVRKCNVRPRSFDG
ncbi:hypothetical protein Tco_1336683 [Tanacetum coccineum]